MDVVSVEGVAGVGRGRAVVPGHINRNRPPARLCVDVHSGADRQITADALSLSLEQKRHMMAAWPDLHFHVLASLPAQEHLKDLKVPQARGDTRDTGGQRITVPRNVSTDCKARLPHLQLERGDRTVI
eukprot:CAMPEP_0204276206 /NCGR_PEP_ID=MMETSP0468-20130131/27583_1 /ASSEMBLY_ACC=CAM_ASM_000383 /TAXON_ID=2969 /ORGANISM="Oxyrrhis marina" /LENGTH=127 /DNA_ID=CAMNT_0051252743 /DNA_START=243 /DNA_END=626 /DNA_ORIENTATION=+